MVDQRRIDYEKRNTQVIDHLNNVCINDIDIKISLYKRIALINSSRKKEELMIEMNDSSRFIAKNQ